MGAMAGVITHLVILQSIPQGAALVTANIITAGPGAPEDITGGDLDTEALHLHIGDLLDLHGDPLAHNWDLLDPLDHNWDLLDLHGDPPDNIGDLHGISNLKGLLLTPGKHLLVVKLGYLLLIQAQQMEECLAGIFSRQPLILSLPTLKRKDSQDVFWCSTTPLLSRKVVPSPQTT